MVGGCVGWGVCVCVCDCVYMYSMHIAVPPDVHVPYSFPQEAYSHVRTCRHHVQPLQVFLEQLSKWEEDVLGGRHTDITHL